LLSYLIIAYLAENQNFMSILRDDLQLIYSWTTPLQESPRIIDNTDFDREQGNNVLDFINLFMLAYTPDGNKATATQIEGIISNIPFYIDGFAEAIYWLAKHYVNIIRRLNYGLLPFSF
jgi:hypothetical protein